jgi:hypothetical protein
MGRFRMARARAVEIIRRNHAQRSTALLTDSTAQKSPCSYKVQTESPYQHATPSYSWMCREKRLYEGAVI